ncbi:MAG: DUF3473 domain-containing protein [Betaproteobacteria bacterium]|nr:DUF3473 domain-containing protein [Betaproteobacteria bacterium]
MVINALTIDVEDYFQVSAFAPYIARATWNEVPRRIEPNMDRILALLDEHRTHATFFTLGWIARRHPGLIRAIVDGGHELASHGYAHRRVTEQTWAAFREDVGRAKKLLEDIGGVRVLGYRAPSFSIGEGNRWAHDVLHAAGYRYSSSVYPIRHDHYGWPAAPRFAFRPHGEKGLIELPASTVPLFGRNLPAAGGGYFRLLPYVISRWLVRRLNAREHAPCIFYFHPWELDAGQPRLPHISLKTRFRHYTNLARMPAKIGALLHDFRWDRMDRVFAEVTA